MSLVTYLVRGQLRRRWRVWLGLVALIAIGGGTSIFAISAWQRTSTAMDRFLEEFHSGNAIAVGSGFDRDALVAQPAILDADSGEYFFLVPHDADGAGHDPSRRRQPVQLRVRPDAARHERRPGHRGPQARPRRGAGDRRRRGAGRGLRRRARGHAAPHRHHPGAVRGHRRPHQHRARRADVRLHGHRRAAAAQRRRARPRGRRRRPPPRDPRPRAHPRVPRRPLPPGRRRRLVLRPGRAPSTWSCGSHRGPPRTSCGPRSRRRRPTPRCSWTRARTPSPARSPTEPSGCRRPRSSPSASSSPSCPPSSWCSGSSRVLGDQAREAGPLLAAGLSAGTLRAVTLITAAAVAVVGAIGAIAISVALSPLSPVGLARRAEPDPGLHVDAAVTFVGALVTVVVALVIALGVAARHRHVLAPAAPGAPSALPARLAAQTSDVAVATGLRFAGRRTGTRIATQLTVGLACLAVIASLTFATSAAATVREPERYGWGWALSVGNPNDPALYQRLVEEAAGPSGRRRGHRGAQRVRGLPRPRRRARRGSPHRHRAARGLDPAAGAVGPAPERTRRGRPRRRHGPTARGRGRRRRSRSARATAARASSRSR